MDQIMPNYRICLITQDNHSKPVTIVCDDDQTAIQRSQKLLDRNDVGLPFHWATRFSLFRQQALAFKRVTRRRPCHN